MTALVACIVLQTGPIQRDSYGVPHIEATSFEQAFELFGQAVAQDRLWQMEMSRLVARGKLASVVGESGVASDRQMLLTGYTDAELAAMVEALPSRAEAAYVAYARGVNAEIEARAKTNSLPSGYAQMGFAPEPWTTIDSAAIAVMLARQFGTGGAGELRNLAMLKYLETRPAAESRFDILDDFLPRINSDSPTTVPQGEGPPPPELAEWDRADTRSQLDSIPPISLFELLPAVQLTELDDLKEMAASVGAPNRFGSYAILVPAADSANGAPMLLNGPQMGFSSPSVVHEISVRAPDYVAAGMNVPGLPGVVIGKGEHIAWGLTSGVADVRDVYYSIPTESGDAYRYGDETRPITVIERPLQVKGGEPITVVQKRTHYGPVVLVSRSTGTIYSVKSTHWLRELEVTNAFLAMGSAANLRDVAEGVPSIPLSFNLFVATDSGETGYWYCGALPLRAHGYDPRFPLPSRPETEWRGLIPEENRPYILNPKARIVNWNNKPIEWWPNGDTPVWGSIFRSEMIARALPDGKLTIGDLERAIWAVARQDTSTNGRFLQLFKPMTALQGPLAKYVPAMDVWQLDGTIPPRVYAAAVVALRRALFEQHVGTFITPDLFAQAAQPSLMLAALNGDTKFDYLAGRPVEQVGHVALLAALSSFDETDPASSWRLHAPTIELEGIEPIVFSDRGTYIQITSLVPGLPARNVLPPGVAESGKHSADQVTLARSWTYKPMQWAP